MKPKERLGALYRNELRVILRHMLGRHILIKVHAALLPNVRVIAMSEQSIRNEDIAAGCNFVIFCNFSKYHFIPCTFEDLFLCTVVIIFLMVGWNIGISSFCVVFDYFMSNTCWAMYHFLGLGTLCSHHSVMQNKWV